MESSQYVNIGEGKEQGKETEISGVGSQYQFPSKLPIAMYFYIWKVPGARTNKFLYVESAMHGLTTVAILSICNYYLLLMQTPQNGKALLKCMQSNLDVQK